MSRDDAAFMRRAFELAAAGRGATSPNPVVGAVVVADGEVVGEGYHRRYGGPHAEVNALELAGARGAGSTLYVTLEPCCVSGNTPPCTDAIIAAGVRRVVVPIDDPNPDVSGRGVAILREAGVQVDVGIMRAEAQALNAPYLKYRATGLPFVTLKLALSLDGRIAAPAGGPRWTSSEASREAVHEMRSEADCVMVGVGTVLVDDPLLTDRRATGGGRQPARLVLDAGLRTPPESRLASRDRDQLTVVACAETPDLARRRALEDVGVEVWPCRSENGLLELEDVLRRAAARGLLSILCEGGARVATSLLEGNLVDRVAFFVAPRLYGSDGTAALGVLGRAWWGGGRRLVNGTWSRVGDDGLFVADVTSASPSDEEAVGVAEARDACVSETAGAPANPSGAKRGGEND